MYRPEAVGLFTLPFLYLLRQPLMFGAGIFPELLFTHILGHFGGSPFAGALSTFAGQGSTRHLLLAF